MRRGFHSLRPHCLQVTSIKVEKKRYRPTIVCVCVFIYIAYTIGEKEMFALEMDYRHGLIQVLEWGG